MHHFSYLVDLVRGNTNIFGYRRAATNRIFLVYCLLGGMYFESRVPPGIRFSWILTSWGFLATLLLGTVLAAVTGNSDTDALLLIIVVDVVGVCILFGSPLIMYQFRKPINLILSIIDNGCDYSTGRKFQDRDLSRSYQIFWFISLGGGVLLAVYVLCCPIDMVLLYDDSKLRDPFHYVYYVPWIPYCTSPILYAITLVAQTLICLPCGLIIMYYSMCTLGISVEIKKSFFDLSNELRSISRRAEGNFALIRSQSEEEVLGSRERKQKDIEYEKFTCELVEIVKRYQKLVSAFKEIKPWLEICASMIILPYFFTQLIPVYLFMLIDSTSLTKFRMMCVLFGGNFMLYTGCMIGEFINDVNKKMYIEVYSIPWFYFPPKHRKIVGIFLAQVQNPIQVFAFSLWPTSMELFPVLVKFTYSYINAFYHFQTK